MNLYSALHPTALFFFLCRCRRAASVLRMSEEEEAVDEVAVEEVAVQDQAADIAGEATK